MGTPTCRLCGDGRSKVVAEEFDGSEQESVYECLGCGITYLHPIMTAEEETAFYEQDFPAYMEHRNAPGGTEPASQFKANLPEAERRAALVQELLEPRMEVLEIGSSTGFFLHVIRDRVRAVSGVEPHREFAAHAGQLGIRTYASMNEAPEQSFDAIFFYYVLEHMRDPIGFLRRLGALLRPGGRLVLEVPNVTDALISTFDIPRFRRFYWQKAHYYYYSRDTLADLMRRSGYAAEIRPVQRYDLSNHMHWMMTGRPGGKGKYNHIFTRAVNDAYAECLKQHWICDTLFAVAQRSGDA